MMVSAIVIPTSIPERCERWRDLDDSPGSPTISYFALRHTS
jgi:hypothetical protein